MKVKFFSAVLSAMILAFSGIGATAFAEETAEKATSADVETTEISETAKTRKFLKLQRLRKLQFLQMQKAKLQKIRRFRQKQPQVKFPIITVMIITIQVEMPRS